MAPRKLVVKVLHWMLVCQGKLEEAHLVLRLLRDGAVELGSDTVGRNVERELADLECRIVYGEPARYPAVAYMSENG